MIQFFENVSGTVYAVQTSFPLNAEDVAKLNWLFGNAAPLDTPTVNNCYVGPRAAMITPWSTNAVEITQNMGISGIIRIEEFQKVIPDFTDFDPMISQKFNTLTQNMFTVNIDPQPILEIEDIAAYNQQEGLALSDEEVAYLNNISSKIGRKLTDSEVFRSEEFQKVIPDFTDFDPMISQKFNTLTQNMFTVNIDPQPILEIEDIAAYNQQEGLALSDEEVAYLNNISSKIGRKLTDSEVFGFSQVNSEHCRHKIFNGTFVIDGVEQPVSLFK